MSRASSTSPAAVPAGVLNVRDVVFVALAVELLPWLMVDNASREVPTSASSSSVSTGPQAVMAKSETEPTSRDAHFLKTFNAITTSKTHLRHSGWR